MSEVCEPTKHNFIYIGKANVSSTSDEKIKDKIVCSKCGKVKYV